MWERCQISHLSKRVNNRIKKKSRNSSKERRESELGCHFCQRRFREMSSVLPVSQQETAQYPFLSHLVMCQGGCCSLWNSKKIESYFSIEGSWVLIILSPLAGVVNTAGAINPSRRSPGNQSSRSGHAVRAPSRLSWLMGPPQLRGPGSIQPSARPIAGSFTRVLPAQPGATIKGGVQLFWSQESSAGDVDCLERFIWHCCGSTITFKSWKCNF